MKKVLLVLTAGLLTGTAAAADDTVPAVEQAITQLNTAFAKGDADAVRRLTTADHVAVTGYYGGPQARDEQLASLKDLQLTAYSAAKLKVTPLGKDAALVTYSLTLKGTFRGQPVPTTNYASAVWVKRDGRWLEQYYQETPLGQVRPR